MLFSGTLRENLDPFGAHPRSHSYIEVLTNNEFS